MKKLRLRDALIISVQFSANYFLDMTLKAKPMKEKIHKFDYIKI